MTVPPCMIPASAAMARAVSALSPVTIRTRIPARWQVATDSAILSLRWSRIPTYPSQVSPVSVSSPSMISLWANASVLIARDARACTSSRSGLWMQSEARISGAPFTRSQDRPSREMTVDIRFRLPSKRCCLMMSVSLRIWR